ncbi:MAG: DUF2007 domain-containing protein [Pseudobdellovibrionaceae bacterium]|nr:DUF2007 domain-containing protein [Bdellovibrionales bacterium]USN48158.1 MAG: DUF2007 domain-containing protein [Pseudobdellovibrionaceae bacterium]
MKPLKRFSSQTEAQLCLCFLSEQGIEATIVGSHEYASIVTGSDLGAFDLMVHEDELERAKSLLETLDNPLEPKNISLVTDDHEDLGSAKFYRNRSFIFALLGLGVIPIVANLVSLINLKKLMQSDPKNLTNSPAIILTIVALNVVGLFIGLYLILLVAG